MTALEHSTACRPRCIAPGPAGPHPAGPVNGPSCSSCVAARPSRSSPPVAIVASLFPPAIRFFRDLQAVHGVSFIEFATGTLWAPDFATPSFGVLPIVVGSSIVVILSLLVSVPVGLLSAIYLSEYAPAAGAQDRQAGTRGPRGRADRRRGSLRLLVPSAHRPGGVPEPPLDRTLRHPHRWHGGSGSSPSRSWPPCPMTPCARSRSRCVRPPTPSGTPRHASPCGSWSPRRSPASSPVSSSPHHGPWGRP